jgi:hypothetical protein
MLAIMVTIGFATGGQRTCISAPSALSGCRTRATRQELAFGERSLTNFSITSTMSVAG